VFNFLPDDDSMNYLFETLSAIQPFSAAILFVFLYVAEHVHPHRKYSKIKKHDLINIAIGFINLCLTFAAGYYFQKYMEWINHLNVGLMPLLHLPLWLQIVISIFLLDLFMYGWHRLNHTIPFFWRFHRLHHTDTQLNSTSSVRFHVVETLLSYVLQLPVLTLLGVSIYAIIAYTVLLVPVVIFHHSNIHIGNNFDKLLRKLIVSPHMHRIHHSVIQKETDSNYSALFPWWDKFFSTYTEATDHEIEFGL
jgi:sterol desaturase/sphingolipid hydroxylase (fatty acid hydroxylase superfamily)